jgi:predicted class III extradiol MEMO1 family dioxygenase
MASIRVDYTIFFEYEDEREGKMFVPISMDCNKQELIECINDAILDTCKDYEDVVGGKAVVHYFGAIFDVEFEIEENEQCQKTIH